MNGVPAPLVMYCGSVPFHLLIASSCMTSGFWRSASPRMRIDLASASRQLQFCVSLTVCFGTKHVCLGFALLHFLLALQRFLVGGHLGVDAVVTVGGYSGFPTATG